MNEKQTSYKYVDSLIQIAKLPELEDNRFKILKAINLDLSLNGSDVKQVKKYSWKNCAIQTASVYREKI